MSQPGAFQSSTVSFADVAHQTLFFDRKDPADRLILELLDTPWVQRLRRISQTGNTRLVYMFAEHSRFGHSLGAAYLASMLMKNLRDRSPEQVRPYEQAVAAAAVLHDIGHVAPGSHLAERVWSPAQSGQHEEVTRRVIMADSDFARILEAAGPALREQVHDILSDRDTMPAWTRSVISGGGWNADRGNWAMVDSAMCSVTYGRYNVAALIDAFRLSSSGELVLQENRLDALTHFFVARDSMYRQVYQHRVLQAADALTQRLVLRLRDLVHEADADPVRAKAVFERAGIFCDSTMLQALLCTEYGSNLPLETLFKMTESWWDYHVHVWCEADDHIVADLARRQRDRRLLKTIRLEAYAAEGEQKQAEELIERARMLCEQNGYAARYYLAVIDEQDKHRSKMEQVPRVILDNGHVVPVTLVEPMIDQIMRRPPAARRWLAIPAEIKAQLGRIR